MNENNIERNPMYEQDAQQPLSMSAMAITGFVIGLVALLTSFLPFINNFSFVFGLLALIFSIVGLVGCVRGKKKGKGLAIAGLIISIIACVVVLWSQSIYSAAIDDAFSTTKAATSTTKAATSMPQTSSNAASSSAASNATTSDTKDNKSSSDESATEDLSVTSASDNVAASEETNVPELLPKLLLRQQALLESMRIKLLLLDVIWTNRMTVNFVL